MALGWNYVHPVHNEATTYSLISFGWFHKGEWKSYKPLPDFINDMNAATKYVWPVIVKIIEQKWGVDSVDVLMEIALTALQSENPALYFAEKLIELKEK